MHRGHFADAHAHFIHLEPGPFPAAHGLFTNFDISWKKEIAPGPAAGSENLGRHVLKYKSQRHNVNGIPRSFRLEAEGFRIESPGPLEKGNSRTPRLTF